MRRRRRCARRIDTKIRGERERERERNSDCDRVKIVSGEREVSTPYIRIIVTSCHRPFVSTNRSAINAPPWRGFGTSFQRRHRLKESMGDLDKSRRTHVLGSHELVKRREKNKKRASLEFSYFNPCNIPFICKVSVH